MEHYITVVADLERNHYPQSIKEAIERAISLDNELYNYFCAINEAYIRLKSIGSNSTSKDDKYKILSDVEGWIKEIAIIYGKLKYLVDYTKDYSYERLRRNSQLILNLEIFLNKSIDSLISESHKTNINDKRYYEFALGIGYDIKFALLEADSIEAL